MQKLYSILMALTQAIFPLLGFVSAKMRLSIEGRKDVLNTLKRTLERDKPVIWFHAASLGEYEQGVPVMQQVKEQYTKHQLVITFFSPSGFVVKKNNAFAKATTYLPLDTTQNVEEFLDVLAPEMVFFIKYEFWPNYLKSLHRRKIRTFLISGVFRESQPFFKWYGAFMKKALHSFEHFFLQDEESAEALRKLGFTNFTVSGDTRFDRVAHQLEMDNTLKPIEIFKDDNLCLVCGSTWPEDEAVITAFINRAPQKLKFIIAPHEIREEKIATLMSGLQKKTLLYSQNEGENIADYDVLIIDSIGLLTKVYSYADIAYVGGAMGTTGLHNILEPATFGVPIVIGPNYEKFPEAKKLRQLAGLYSVSTDEEFVDLILKMIEDDKFRSQAGMIAGHFVNSNTGATTAVIKYLE